MGKFRSPDIKIANHSPMFSYRQAPYDLNGSMQTDKWNVDNMTKAWYIAGDDDFKQLPETRAHIKRRKRKADKATTHCPLDEVKCVRTNDSVVV